MPIDVAAAERARWLAELSLALDEAQTIVSCLAVAEGRYVETLDVSARIESARAEVRSLRRSRIGEPTKDIDPYWSENFVSLGGWPEQRA